MNYLLLLFKSAYITSNKAKKNNCLFAVTPSVQGIVNRSNFLFNFFLPDLFI